MKHSFLITAMTLLLTSSLFAQRDETLFNKFRLTGAWGGFSYNMTSVGADNVTLRGGFGGVEFGKSFFVGWGSYRTDNGFFIRDLTSDRFDMDYNGLILGYTPNAYKVFHLKGNVLIGGGDVTNSDTFESDNFFVIQPSIGVEVNIFRWFRLGLDGGYRVMLNGELPGLSSADLSAAYGQVSFKFGWSWGRKRY